MRTWKNAGVYQGLCFKLESNYGNQLYIANKESADALVEILNLLERKAAVHQDNAMLIDQVAKLDAKITELLKQNARQ